MITRVFTKMLKEIKATPIFKFKSTHNEVHEYHNEHVHANHYHHYHV
jgi:hypothetical protein